MTPQHPAEDAHDDAMEPLSSWNWEPPPFVREPKLIEVSCNSRMAHLEAGANAIIGIILAQLVLLAFGMPMQEAMALNMVMIGVSYARSFVLRLVFARLAR